MKTTTSIAKLTFTQKFETIASFRDLPVKGDIHLLTQATSFVSVNWEGDVEKVILVSDINKIHDSFFDPSDKGGLAIFGVDSQGDVIFGMAKYVKGSSEDPEAQYYVKSCTSTQTHPW